MMLFTSVVTCVMYQVGSLFRQHLCTVATANPVGGKACSSTKGGKLRYILNTYSIHKVSSLKFAYFQGRLSRHITSPSEKTRPESWPPESWPGDYMGKASVLAVVIIPPLIHEGWFTAL